MAEFKEGTEKKGKEYFENMIGIPQIKISSDTLPTNES